jgi:hypothetical protein
MEQVEWHQKRLMEPILYDSPQNIDRNSAIIMNRSTLSHESGSLDPKCDIDVALLDHKALVRLRAVSRNSRN